jgi:hypothetical protein
VGAPPVHAMQEQETEWPSSGGGYQNRGAKLKGSPKLLSNTHNSECYLVNSVINQFVRIWRAPGSVIYKQRTAGSFRQALI